MNICTEGPKTQNSTSLMSADGFYQLKGRWHEMNICTEGPKTQNSTSLMSADGFYNFWLSVMKKIQNKFLHAFVKSLTN
jgi:hypothetical protein